MCSSRTKNWFQIQPLLGRWWESLSLSSNLVWFLCALMDALEVGLEIMELDLAFVIVCEKGLSLEWDLGFDSEAGLAL